MENPRSWLSQRTFLAAEGKEVHLSVSAPEYRSVGVVTSASDRDVFPLVAAALRARGVVTVARLDVPAPDSPASASRLLLWADRKIGRWLSGSIRPGAPATAAGADADAPPTSLDDPTLEAVIVIGNFADGGIGPLPGVDVYRLDLGDLDPDFPAAPGAAEVLGRRDAVHIRLRQSHGRPVFRGGVMAVQTHLCCIHLTESTILASLPLFLDGALKPWKAGQSPAALAGSLADATTNGRRGWLAAVRHLSALSGALVERLLFRFQWILAVMPAPPEGAAIDWNQLRPVLPPDDRLWADPFLVRRDNQTWLFFEDAPFRSAKGADIGHVSVASVGPQGLTGPVTVALDLPWHLSYPHVFEHHDDWYMLPESGSQGRVELYRCKRWPDEWSRHSTLLEAYQGYDASIVRADGRFWMFVARRATGVPTTDFLDLFTAPSPLGPWALHPASPVVQDVRSARPAGRILVRNDHLTRPAQDSSGGLYGRALRLQEVTRLDDEGFEERPGPLIEPNRAAGIVGIHSFAREGDVIVVDLCRRVWRAPMLRRFGRVPGRPLVRVAATQ